MPDRSDGGTAEAHALRIFRAGGEDAQKPVRQPLAGEPQRLDGGAAGEVEGEQFHALAAFELGDLHAGRPAQG